MKSLNVYGVTLTPLENLKFSEFLIKNKIGMNSKTKEEQREFVVHWLHNQMLQHDYESVVMKYIQTFAEKHDLEFDSWINFGEVAVFGDMYVSFDDLRRDINLQVPSHIFTDWYWACIDNAPKYINFSSYIMGLRYTDIQDGFNDSPFLKDTKVKCFDSPEDLKNWQTYNCDSCVKREMHDGKSEPIKCELAFHLDKSKTEKTVPLRIVKRIGAKYDPLYLTAVLSKQCWSYKNINEQKV